MAEDDAMLFDIEKRLTSVEEEIENLRMDFEELRSMFESHTHNKAGEVEGKATAKSEA